MALIICFLLVPFGFLSHGLIHKGHHFAFIISALVVLGSHIKNIYARLFVYYAGAWVTWVLLSNLFIDRNYHRVGLTIKALTFFVAAVALFVAVIRSKVRLETFYNVICISAIIQAVLCAFQLNGFDPLIEGIMHWLIPVKRLMPISTMVGTMGNNNFVAAYLAISLPFFFRKWWWYFIPVIVTLLYFSYTTTAVVAALIGCAVYFQQLKLIPVFLIGTVLYAFWMDIDGSLMHSIRIDHGRVAWWRNTLANVLTETKTAVFGYGPGSLWGERYKRLHPIHNEWVTLLYQYGVIGVWLIIGALSVIYREYFRTKNNRMLISSLTIIVVNMIGNYPFHLAPSAFLAMIVFGLLERERNNETVPINSDPYFGYSTIPFRD